MALFQKSILDKYIGALDKETLALSWGKFKKHFHDIEVQENIRNSKEEQYQEGFFRDLFVDILGYTLNPNAGFNLTTEKKNVKDSKKADGAIIIEEKIIAVIELKGTNTTDLASVETQAFGYMNNQEGCVYVITSNFEKLRFYIGNAIEHIEFNLFALTEKEFEVLYLCLSFQNIRSSIPKKLKDESLSQEDTITKNLYKDYSLFKRELYSNLIELNSSYDQLLLFKKSQKLLDRFLFILFGEDRNLLPPNSVRDILKQWNQLKDLDEYKPLYSRYKKYFNYLNEGHKGKHHNIFAYNGGLFKPDEVLDNILINDDILYKHTLKLSEYDFASEVDVNILGHIFENSLNELDEIKSQLEGQEVEKNKTKRKKDGVFYTPKYITKYIVENTVGSLCNEKKKELSINDEDYYTERKQNKATKEKHLNKLKVYRNWLLHVTIIDPACGSGAFLNEALNFLIEEHSYIDELETKLLGGSIQFQSYENSILENNLFGVDINEESVEIAKLSLWLRTAQPNRKLNNLNQNIKCGNSLIDDPSIAGEKAFDWQKEFPKVFEKGGFDIVIGNPPYVQLQSSKELSEGLGGCSYKTFEKTGDLYCLFYEKGNDILKDNGILGFITSNKWLRANYGKSLRTYLLKNTQPQLLIDLGSGIFESATVDSNILIFKKTNTITNQSIQAIDLSKEKIFTDFTIYETKKVEIAPKEDDIWIISNPIEQQLKQKIETKGTPLKDWDIEIFRGVLTGYNDAFIIDTDKRNELVQAEPKCSEIIKPILRGKDINRYNADWADLWIINTHNGYNGIPKINIEEYPAIKNHLDLYYTQLEKRYDKGDTPYNLRNCAYVSKFNEQKIIYQEMVQKGEFLFDINNNFCLDTGRIITGKNLKYLLSLLNSKLFFFSIKNYYGGGGLGTTGVRMKHTFFENFPAILPSNQEPFIEKADLEISLHNQLNDISDKFIRSLNRELNLSELSTKLQEWYQLDFEDFLNEIKKKKVTLSLSLKSEWEDYFNQEKEKALEIKNKIDLTDKEIDKMVYYLYGLNEEEIAIIEGK